MMTFSIARQKKIAIENQPQRPHKLSVYIVNGRIRENKNLIFEEVRSAQLEFPSLSTVHQIFRNEETLSSKNTIINTPNFNIDILGVTRIQ